MVRAWRNGVLCIIRPGSNSLGKAFLALFA
jgi:hypothetical protein